MLNIILITIIVIHLSEAYEYESRAVRRHPLDKGVRFGYQNPIRVAPTLPPFEAVSTDNYPDGSDLYPVVSVRPPPISPSLGCKFQVDGNGMEIHSRLDQKTRQCIQLGSTEPCGRGRNMAFYARDDVNGECDCVRNTRRPLVYHERTNTCYFIYQQAYCPPEMWLVLDTNRKPLCQDNICHIYGTRHLQWDWTDNTNTLKMNTQGIVPIFDKMQCVPLGSTCEADGSFKLPPTGTNGMSSTNVPQLQFQVGDIQPDCFTNVGPEKRGSLFSDVGQEVRTRIQPRVEMLDCRPGSKFNILDQC